MSIIFKQPEGEAFSGDILESVGIKNCYFKEISAARDSITKKEHHHTGVEIHIVECGFQTYEINGETVKVNAGSFLLIPPMTEHRAAETSKGILKYSFSFSLGENSVIEQSVKNISSYISAKTPRRIKESIKCICIEKKSKAPMYESVILGRIFECLVFLFRNAGIVSSAASSEYTREDSRLTLAKQYIKDNVTNNISVSDVALYCCMSTKQISRIFSAGEGVSLGEYVRRERVKYIEKLLSDTSLSLREISEKMNFNNEYYFNLFFKKYSGMSPGAYRKSVGGNCS